MVLGTLVSVAAVTVFARLLRQDGGGWMASASPVVFGIGGAAFLGTLLIGLALTPGAAAELVRTGVVPSGFVRWQRVATGLYVGHMLLSFATFALLAVRGRRRHSVLYVL